MNFKDRGNKKWNSLMLVEHQKRLQKLKRREKDLEKPELDPQQIQEINSKIKMALDENLTLSLKFYENKRIKNLEGKILKIEKYKQQLKIRQKNQQIKTLAFSQIIELIL